MPWALCFSVIALAAVPLFVGYAILPSQLNLTAVSAGLATGVIGALVAPPRAALVALGLAAAAGLLTLGHALPYIGWISGALLVLAVAWEAHRGPSRAAIAGLFGWLTLILAPGGFDTPIWVLVPFVGAALWVILGVRLLGVSGVGMARHRAMSRPATVALTASLLLGGAISVGLTLQIDHPKSYWVALLFVLRALEPMETHRSAAFRFALGGTLGVVGALALEALAPAAVPLAILAPILVVLGLRFLPMRTILSPACFTGAVLLATAPTFADAVMRVEAIAVAVGLAVGLTFFAGLVLDGAMALARRVDARA